MTKLLSKVELMNRLWLEQDELDDYLREQFIGFSEDYRKGYADGFGDCIGTVSCTPAVVVCDGQRLMDKDFALSCLRTFFHDLAPRKDCSGERLRGLQDAIDILEDMRVVYPRRIYDGDDSKDESGLLEEG